MFKKILTLEETYDEYRQAMIYSKWEKAILKMELLVEKISFCDVDELEEFFDNQNSEDVMGLYYWVRILIIRIMVLRNPDDKELLSKAIGNIGMFVADDPEFLVEMKNKLKSLNEADE